MTFLWADIPFEWTCISLRYHNDMFWNNYKRSHHVRYIWSIIQMIPVFAAGFYQLYKHQTTPDYYHKIKKGAWDQFIVMFFAAPVPFYYLIDLTISIVEGTFFEPCRFWLWFHHMVSMVVIPPLILRNEYEWQDTLIMATHTLLMKFPFIFLFIAEMPRFIQIFFKFFAMILAFLLCYPKKCYTIGAFQNPLSHFYYLPLIINFLIHPRFSVKLFIYLYYTHIHINY